MPPCPAFGPAIPGKFAPANCKPSDSACRAWSADKGTDPDKECTHMATAEMTAPPQARPVQRLQLTDGQKQLILRTVAELIAATTTGRQPSFPDPTLDGLAGQPIAGAFVTLRRGK